MTSLPSRPTSDKSRPPDSAVLEHFQTGLKALEAHSRGSRGPLSREVQLWMPTLMTIYRLMESVAEPE